MSSNDELIKKLEEQRSAIDLSISNLKLYSVEMKFADQLHELVCRSSHIDGCGYEYESWNKPSYSKPRWLEKATKILSLVKGKDVSEADILTIISIATK